jgi:hypothetical protein
MATTGKAAWEKYYEGQGNVETFLSKDSPTFDIKTNASQKNGVLHKGTKITVLESKKYDSKPVISYQKGKQTYKVRVSFDCIQKPGIKVRGASPGARTIPNKALTPNGLGLNGDSLTKRNFVSKVTDALGKSKVITPHIKEVCIDILNKSGSSNQILSESIKSISDPDIAVIGKDFGELAGAWWFLNNYEPNLVSVEYPTSITSQLVDYHVKDKSGLIFQVSAKYDDGAAPSISNVWNMISDKRFSKKSDIVVKLFIEQITKNSGKEGIVKAAETINSKSYQIISSLMKDTNLTDEKIENWLETYKDPNKLFDFLNKNYYSKIGKSAKFETIQKIFVSKQKRSGIVTSPMAYSTVDEVNENSNYTDFLTKACATAQVHQLYLTIHKSRKAISFDVRKFNESKFEFEYHSNAGNPGGNKIGFALVK